MNLRNWWRQTWADIGWPCACVIVGLGALIGYAMAGGPIR